MPPSLTTYTYRVTDERARVVERPMGRLIRHLGLDNHVRGIPDAENPEWVKRLDDTGIFSRGYVRATLLEQLETSIGVTSIRHDRAFTLAQGRLPPAMPVADRSVFPSDFRVGTYRVTNPSGRHETITNLAQFCRSHDLSYDAMCSVVMGRQRQHRGWKVKRIR